MSSAARTEPRTATALIDAAAAGQLDVVRTLLGEGAEVDQVNVLGGTALMRASYHGHVECVRALLGAAADVHKAEKAGRTALMIASNHGQVECVRALLDAGADARRLDQGVNHALLDARRYLAVLQLLCAYGAQREQLIAPDGSVRRPGLHDKCLAWLLETRCWTTELHHVEFLPAAKVRALIVAGADLHASDSGADDAPTPLAIARALLVRIPDGHAGAQLVVDAAAPWSAANHALFPKAARDRAVALLLLGHLLSQEEQFKKKERALLDVWQDHVMPRAVHR